MLPWYLHRPAQGFWQLGGSGFLLEALFATFELTTEKARPSEGYSNWGPQHPGASRRVVEAATSARWGLPIPCPVPHPACPTFNQAALLLSLLHAGILNKTSLDFCCFRERERRKVSRSCTPSHLTGKGSTQSDLIGGMSCLSSLRAGPQRREATFSLLVQMTGACCFHSLREDEEAVRAIKSPKDT